MSDELLEAQKLLIESWGELKHARVFIGSREKMADVGIEQYDELTARIGMYIHEVVGP